MTQRPILVTGGNGFVGPYLIAALEAAGERVVACGAPLPHGAHAGFPPHVAPHWHALDLRDRAAVDALVAEIRPRAVYHLAALSSVAASLEEPLPTYQVNVMGTLHLLDALRRQAPDARVLFVSSAEVYGGLASPLTEASPFAPSNPYAGSKAAGEMLCIEAFRTHGLAVMRARAFNHTGPGQSPQFVVSDFARQVARIEAGLQAPVIAVGNLSARRDFLDVRDVVSAYVSLMASGEPGQAYNVCSGSAVAVQDLLDGLLALSRVPITVSTDPARMRPVDVPELVGSHAALSAAAGWRPAVPLDRTLADVLGYWRERVAAETAAPVRP